MRPFAPFALAVALLVGAGCSGGDGGNDASASRAEARRVVARAQLTARDLGPDWTKTADEAPTTGAGGDDQLEKCVGTDLGVADDTLAESHVRTFERATGDVDRQQLVASTAVLRSASDVEDLFALVSTDKFAGCIAQAIRSELSASAAAGDGVEVVAGRATVEDDIVAGAAHSAHITAPFRLHIPPLDLTGQADVVMVSSGRPVSLMFGFSVGESIGEARFGELARRLLARQRA